MPPPTQALFETMAEIGYIEMLDRAKICGELDKAKKEGQKIFTWDQTPLNVKERWIAAAKAMYAQVALFGGAKSTMVSESSASDLCGGSDPSTSGRSLRRS